MAKTLPLLGSSMGSGYMVAVVGWMDAGGRMAMTMGDVKDEEEESAAARSLPRLLYLTTRGRWRC